MPRPGSRREAFRKKEIERSSGPSSRLPLGLTLPRQSVCRRPARDADSTVTARRGQPFTPPDESANPEQLVMLDTEAPPWMRLAVLDRRTSVVLQVRTVHWLQEPMIEAQMSEP